MALDRYQGGGTPFQQTSSVGYQAQAQTMASLTNKLDYWNTQAFEVAKKQVTEEGQQQAIADMTSGEPAKLEKGYSFYADAYNTVAKAAYNIDVESDLKKKANELEASDPLNPTKFNEVFEGYTKGAMSKIEDPNFKAIYWQQAKKIGATTYNGMAKKSYENALKNQEDVINAGMSELKINYESSFANGNIEDMTHNIATYTALLENKVKLGTMDAKMIPFELKKLTKGAQENKAMLELDNSIASGNTNYINDYMKTPEYQSLSFDERTAITKRMHEHTDIKYKAMNDEALGADKFLDAASKRTSIEVMKKVYSGQDVSEQSLQQMVADGLLSKPDYDKIAQDVADMKGGASVDNSQVVTSYELNIESVSPRTIAQDNRISAKTKQRLISKAISHKETVRANDALAQAYKQQRLTTGTTSWQSAQQYIKANIVNDLSVDIENQTKNRIMNQIREEAKSGKISPLEADIRAIELVDEYNNKNKASRDSNTYDKDIIKYNSQVTEYRRNQKLPWYNLTKEHIGVVPPPPPPTKPTNYIPKDRRN